MTKILYITVRSDHGGGPNHILQLIKGLSSTFEIYIACPKDEPYFAIFSGYAECIEIPHRKFSIYRLLSLYKLVNEKKIDIIHSHGKGAGLYSRILGALCRKPVVHAFHGLHHAHMNFVSRFAYLCVERGLGRLTRIFINVSESERASCMKANLYEKSNSTVIPNGVVVPAFRQRPCRDGAEFKLITVSRLSYIKGNDVLLDVVKSLTLLTRNFKLRIVGDGEDRERLEKKARMLGIQDNVAFLGFRKDVPELLEEADLFLSSSRGEGMPIAVLEAMARGLPVVASDVIGNRDAVMDGKTGFLYDINSPGEGAGKVFRLISEPRLYETFSRNAYLTAVENYSAEKMCESVKNIYMSLSGGGHGKTTDIRGSLAPGQLPSSPKRAQEAGRRLG